MPDSLYNTFFKNLPFGGLKLKYSADSECNDQNHHICVLSIEQGIVLLVMEQVFLGSTLYQAMRSRRLVELLHKARHMQLQANSQVGHLTSARLSLVYK